MEQDISKFGQQKQQQADRALPLLLARAPDKVMKKGTKKPREASGSNAGSRLANSSSLQRVHCRC